ncbi:EthD family reductase [Chloroflexota bacterium]
MADKPVIWQVGTSIPTFGSPEKTDQYIDWYTKVHLPLTAKAPGILRGNLYRCIQPQFEHPNFMAIYELESKQAIDKALQSPEMLKAIEDGHQNGSSHGMVVRWQVFYEQV